MAQALRSAVAGSARIETHFEVHVLHDGRWLIDCTARAAADALAEARDILRKPEIGGVKVIKEKYDPRSDQAAARVIFSHVKPPMKIRHAGFFGVMPRPTAPAARDEAPPAEVEAGAAEPLPPMPSFADDLAPGGSDLWALFIWGSLALAVIGALTFATLVFAG